MKGALTRLHIAIHVAAIDREKLSATRAATPKAKKKFMAHVFLETDGAGIDGVIRASRDDPRLERWSRHRHASRVWRLHIEYNRTRLMHRRDRPPSRCILDTNILCRQGSPQTKAPRLHAVLSQLVTAALLRHPRSDGSSP